MVSERDTFKVLVDKAMTQAGYRYMRPVIEKELLHYDILFALESQGLLDQLSFQGGTALRLCYGAQRFSEDLDFVGGTDFTNEHALKIKACIEDYVGDRYGLDVSVTPPPHSASSEHVVVKNWKVKIVTAPAQKDIPKQMIKVQIANVPAHSREPHSLRANYDFLPDGYDDILIMTETLDEILADKLISLPNQTRYIRHRDIWDLRWLTQHGATIVPEYIVAKIRDYHVENYPNKLNNMLDDLENIIHGNEFKNEMQRFIPLEVQERTLLKDKFLDFLTHENTKLLQAVKSLI